MIDITKPALRYDGYCDWMAVWTPAVDRDTLRALRKDLQPRLFVIQDHSTLMIGARLDPPQHPAVAVAMAYGLMARTFQKTTFFAPPFQPPKIRITKMDEYRIAMSRAGPRDLPYDGPLPLPAIMERRDGLPVLVEAFEQNNDFGGEA